MKHPRYSCLRPDPIALHNHVLTVQQLIYIGRILLLLALAFSKCTVFLFIRNLFTHETKGVWRACNILSALAMCWGVVSILIVSIGCSTTDLLSGSSQSCSAEVRGKRSRLTGWGIWVDEAADIDARAPAG